MSILENIDLEQLQERANHFESGGQIDQAIAAYRQVLQHEPSHVPALTQLGTIFVDRSDFRQALLYFKAALDADPNNTTSLCNLGVLYMIREQPDLAFPQFRAAYDIDPSDTESLLCIGDCLIEVGRSGDAVDFLEQELDRHAGDHRILSCLGRAKLNSGDHEGAIEIFGQVLSKNPEHPTALIGLAQSSQHDSASAEPLLARIHNAVGSEDAAQDIGLHFAAGKIYRELKQYDQSFESCLKAHSLRQGRFDLSKTLDRAAHLKRLITPEFIAARSIFSSPANRPIFVFGMPRSGTTLVEQVLASHPKIHGAGELTFFINVDANLGRQALPPEQYVQNLSGLSFADAGDISKSYLMQLHRSDPDHERVVDKMPHNFHVLWLMALLFPKATFIHCVRDPLDNCLSIFSQYFLGHYYSADLDTLGRYYKDYYSDLMSHWKSVLPVPILDVQYEDNVSDLEASARRIVAHAGLEWDNACLQFHKTERQIRTASHLQARQPIYRSSVKAWRHYADNLGPLIDSLGDLAVTD